MVQALLFQIQKRVQSIQIVGSYFAALLEAMMFEMKRTNAWIGLNKMSSLSYEWVDGTPYQFQHWKEGYPKDVRFN